MVKAVLFDVGGVMLDMKLLTEQFVNIFQPKRKKDLWDELNIESSHLCRGEISELEFWRGVAKKMERNIPDDKLKDLWIRDYERLTNIDKEVMSIVESLRGKYKLGVVSNTIESHTLVNRKRGIFDHFDEVILSHEVKMTKENPDIFMLASGKLGVLAAESVFIDDVEYFANTAKLAGMESIHFKTPSQLKEDLAKLGIKV